ncbi:Rne/Rng family ribonuclease, partial [Neoroseomonas rubea]|uniref:Rne/Rng family ribonuclease n=1 Tax=Neoroseomonas rubea TaxID=2748666 RepID=UPI0018E05DD9
AAAPVAAEPPPGAGDAEPPAAQPLDMAEERITGTPDAGLDPEPVAAEGEDAGLGRVESLPAEEEAPPPETIGGEDLPAETEEERRERRIPPKFLRHYKIQEVIRRRQIMLVQVVKEERGNKGAALTTYISLAGRFSVLMPNSPRGGGVSRKITSAADRKRLREVVEEMSLPDGMSLIVRTAGAQRPKPEIKRDCEYLLRLWDSIRERTLASTAPALIYEEADLIKRSIRDVYGRDIDEVVVEGDDAYAQAREFMRMLMPANSGRIRMHRDAVPLFARHNVDTQLDAMHSPVVQLKSGGYVVINQTEALVAIDVNSGRATRDRHIEDTALRTNLEAADEIARQLRLRDLAGLIVIDFIDMESSKHDGMVERRLKEALKHDRARIQVGRISHFGLLEMSRQRLRPSIAEQTFVACPHCQGRGIVRSVESSALQVLRAVEEEGAKRRAAEIMVRVAAPVALWLLNRKRERLAEIEARFGMAVLFEPDDTLMPPALKIERLRAAEPGAVPAAPSALRMDYAPEPVEAEEPAEIEAEAEEGADTARQAEAGESAEDAERRRRRRRRRRGGRRED